MDLSAEMQKIRGSTESAEANSEMAKKAARIRRSMVNSICAGSYAAQPRQPRQVRKEATVTGQCARSGSPGTFCFRAVFFLVPSVLLPLAAI